MSTPLSGLATMSLTGLTTWGTRKSHPTPKATPPLLRYSIVCVVFPVRHVFSRVPSATPPAARAGIGGGRLTSHRSSRPPPRNKVAHPRRFVFCHRLHYFQPPPSFNFDHVVVLLMRPPSPVGRTQENATHRALASALYPPHPHKVAFVTSLRLIT